MPENIPAAFLNRIRQQFGDRSELFVQSLYNDPSVSIRLNPLKSCKSLFLDQEVVPWCAMGRYLDQKPVFTLDPLFHAGCYYPQEASSMVIDWLLRNVCRLPDNPKVLDLCGAPGGKSTLLASWLNGDGLLVANEVIKSRAVVLYENLVKWGAVNTVVTRNDPNDFSEFSALFDLMVVDAPCSGEGMFRKDQRAVDEWSPANARMCSLRQQRILSDVWPALKEGGFLIYSTCTFNPAENEENMAWFSSTYGAEVLPIEVPESWGVASVPVGQGNGLAFYPHQVRGEGFFVCVLRKTMPEKAADYSRKQRKQKVNEKSDPGLSRFLTLGQSYKYKQEGDQWIVFPEAVSNEIDWLLAKLNVVGYGIKMGQFLKGKFMPAHELAMSVAINKEAFSSLELSENDALRYLKGEALVAPETCERGIVLVTCQGVPLGFARNIGNRMNNLYPTNWRIRMPLPG